MNPSAFAWTQASLTRANFSSDEECSWIVPINPYSMFSRTEDANRTGSWETRPVVRRRREEEGIDEQGLSVELEKKAAEKAHQSAVATSSRSKS